MNTGTVYLVGAGPGDAGLITVRGMALIQKADVIVYDRLVGSEVLALLPESAEKLDVGKNAGNHPVPQEEIGLVLLREAQKHRCVVRLKGGDPFVFGRGGEEAELLAAHGVPFEIVPGVTSAVAAPAYAGIPVTHRDFSSSLHIITGHGKGDSEVSIDYPSLKKLGGTLVFMMSVATAPAIVSGLIAAGMDETTPAAVIENGTSPRQRSFTGTLRGLPELIKDNRVASPAVIVVGGVCRAAEQLAWLSRRPLFGCRVLVTRPREVAVEFGAALRELGADVTFYPCIKTRPIDFELRLDGIHWVIFTSAAGVHAFFARLMDMGHDARAFGSARIASVGAKTAAALKQYCVKADFIPEKFDGASLARELLESGRVKPAQTAVLFRAMDGAEELAEILRGAGVGVMDVPVYETVYLENASVDPDAFDYVTFTSASCVKAFAASNKTVDITRLQAVCIGEQTASAARDAGMCVIISEHADTASMTKTLTEVWKCL